MGGLHSCSYCDCENDVLAIKCICLVGWLLEGEGEATGCPLEEETVPEPPTNPSGGRARWLRHRLERLRLQRQRSAPGGTSVHQAGAPVDDTVSSHIQMLNSLDSQVGP